MLSEHVVDGNAEVVGAKVIVGADVGVGVEVVGHDVGFKVASSDDDEGTMDGTFDALLDGMLLGIDVGAIDDNSVGSLDGLLLGKAL